MKVSGGNVGIGSNTPAKLLDVAGTFQARNGLFYSNNATHKTILAHAVLSLRNDGVDDTYNHGRPCLSMDWDTGTNAQWVIGQGGVTGVDGDSSTMGIGWGEAGTFGWSPDFFFTKDGRLGIGAGAKAPKNKMQIFGNKGLTISPSTTTGIRTAVLRLGTPYNDDHDAYCAKITSTNDQSSNYNSDLKFYTSIGNNASATERMCITSNGNVGIGITNPYAKIHPQGVNGSVYAMFSTGGSVYIGGYQTHYLGTGNRRYIFNGSPSSVSTTSTNVYSSIKTGYSISCPSIYVFSDRRIKKNIIDIDDNEALDKLRLLQPKKYHYKDNILKSDKQVFGFIAQEVKEVIPEAVGDTQETIPNIFERCIVTSIDGSYNQITFNDFDTSNLDASSNEIVVTDLDNTKHTCNIINIIDNKNIVVDCDLIEHTCQYDNDEIIENTKDENGNIIVTGIQQIFVYGQTVNDFNALEKNHIWTLTTAALQQIDREFQQEKVKTANLETKVTNLETQLAAVLARLDALENNT